MPLLGGPGVVLGEEDIRGKRWARAAVVELEDQPTRVPRQVIEEQMPESILLLGEKARSLDL
jgi:hypothetical protein